METTVQGVDIEILCRWRKPKEVQTANGPRILRTAKPTEPFWQAWESSKAALKSAGVSVSPPNQFHSEHEACWWQELPREEVERRSASLNESRALDADIEVPANEGLAYRGYQLAGIKYMSERAGTYLGDDMGIGKTIQVIGLINYKPEIHRVLVFTKAGLKLNWYKELRKWLTRDLSVGIADAQVWPSTDIVIANYDIAHKWPNRLSFYWDLVVLDEAQKVKSRSARMSKAIVGFQPTRSEAEQGKEPSSGIPARVRVALSGTPIENKVQELYTVLHWLQPEKFPSRWKFEKQFCESGIVGGHWSISGPKDFERNQAVLRETCLLRRLKRDVLTELPPKVRQICLLDAKGMEKDLQASWSQFDMAKEELAAVEAEMELAKTGDDWKDRVKELKKRAFVPFNEIAKVRHQEALAKVPKAVAAIKDDLEELGTSKALVFFHHRDVGEALAAEFKNAVLITGETPLRDRDQLVTRFQSDPDCGPFLGSIRATGEGLNLTAASLVVFVEEDPVPGRMVQCEDRAHRIGQEDSVLVKHYVVDGSLDANYVKLQVAKQEVADKLLDEVVSSQAMDEPELGTGHRSLGTRSEIESEATIVTHAQSDAALCGIKELLAKGAEMDGVDRRVASALAGQLRLTEPQAVLARKLCFRYAGQLAPELVAAMGGWKGDEK